MRTVRGFTNTEFHDISVLHSPVSDHGTTRTHNLHPKKVAEVSRLPHALQVAQTAEASGLCRR
jgi:hypothetical protein